MELKFQAGDDVQCYRKDQLVDKSIVYDQDLAREAAERVYLEELTEKMKSAEKMANELKALLESKNRKYLEDFPQHRQSFAMSEQLQQSIPPTLQPEAQTV
jgi:hypothetical protein